MKKKISILLFFAASFSNSLITAKTLQDLITSGKVKAKLIGTGAYQNECLQLCLHNLGKEALTISLEPGLKFNSLLDSEQDLLLTQSKSIILAAGKEQRMILTAFCCQASQRAPHAGGIYEVARHQDTSLKKLAQFMSPRHFNNNIVQHAIWTISDRHNVSCIPDSTEALQSLRIYLSELSGQKIPWYHMDLLSGRTASGRLWQAARKLTATIIINNDQEDYVTLTVIDKDGLACAKILKHWLKAGQQMRYELDIPIATLPWGEYSVVLETKTKTLFRDQFKVEGMS